MPWENCSIGLGIVVGIILLAYGIKVGVKALLDRLLPGVNVGAPRHSARDVALGQDESPVIPFDDIEFTDNADESTKWEVDQAIRRARSLVRKNQVPEAVRLLQDFLENVDGLKSRELLTQEINMIQATQPGPQSDETTK